MNVCGFGVSGFGVRGEAWEMSSSSSSLLSLQVLDGLAFEAHRLLYHLGDVAVDGLVELRHGRRVFNHLPRLLSGFRVSMAHIRQPRPDSGLGFQVKVLQSPASHQHGLIIQGPLSNEYGTYTTVKARLWPWLSGKSP